MSKPVGDQIISVRLRPDDRERIEELGRRWKYTGRGALSIIIRRALWAATADPILAEITEEKAFR